MKRIHIVKYILLLILILAISAWLILLANGYKINPRNYKLEKTGMIYLESTPAHAEVFINNEYRAAETPFKLADIFPDRYDVKISAAGFYDWQETLWAEPEQVKERKYIVLFYQEPAKVELTATDKNNYQKQFDSPNPSLGKNLFIKSGNEIWFGDVFVTRLSQDIKKIAWYYDKKHILYQVDKKINIMDVNGTNIVTLVELASDKVADFFSDDSGETLIYKDSELVSKIKITQKNGIIDNLTPNILK